MKTQAELEKARVRTLFQNIKQLTSPIVNIQAPYVWLYNSLDFMVRTQKIPLASSFIEYKRKHQPKKEIEEYLEQ